MGKFTGPKPSRTRLRKISRNLGSGRKRNKRKKKEGKKKNERKKWKEILWHLKMSMFLMISNRKIFKVKKMKIIETT